MIAQLAQFHFLRPWWLLALIALPLIGYALAHARESRHAWTRVIDAHLLPHLVSATPSTSGRRLGVLAYAAWVVATLAVAGPAWERLPAPLYRNQAAHVIALELSPSMLATDVKPDRLTRARYKIGDLLDRLRDGQSALLGYAGDAFVVAPMTDDVNTLRNLLDSLDPSVMPVQGNATSAAIERAVAMIEQAGLSGGDVLLVADSVDGAAVATARQAWSKGVRISVLGVGTLQGAPISLPQGGFLKDESGAIAIPRLSPDALRAVADAGGGRYADLAADTTDLDRLLDAKAPAPAAASMVGTDTATTATFRDRGPLLALLLIPLLLPMFRRGLLLVLPLALLVPPPAHALSWQDLWQRADQQAWHALQQGDADAAAALARDPDLRGAAHFRAKDFESAASDFSRGPDADAAYNRGNALAAQQQYEKALQAYDDALKRDPAHADALANKKAVEDWLRQQQQKSPKSDKSTDSNDASQDQQDEGDQGESSQPQQGGDESKNSQESGDSDAADESKSRGKDGKSSPDADGSPDESDKGGKGEQEAREAQDEFKKSMDRALEQAKADAEKADAQKDDAGKSSPSPAEQQRQESEQTPVAGGASADAPKDGKPVAAEAESDSEAEHRQAMQQWLQRVPDDPGGLLRRKFQLEHERRRREAAGGQ